MPTSTRPLKAAIIGVGKAALVRTWNKGGGHQIGYDHAAALNAQPGVRVVTAADINAENLAAFQARFDVARGHTDYREMLADERPDIVGICTYVGLHARIALDCIAAGVRVILCEKPFVASPAELRAVREAADRAGTFFGIAHIRRFAPCFLKARELLLGGAIGHPVFMAGGLEGWDLSEFGSHWIDLMRFLRDDAPVVHVMGQARVREARGYGHSMEDQAVAYFEFADGCRGLVDGGRGLVPNRSGDIRVVGTEGLLSISENVEVNLYNARGHERFPTPTDCDLWREIYASLLAWNDGGPESPVSLRRCYPSAEINLAAYLSALRGDRIDLPLSGAEADYDAWPVDALSRRSATPIT
jgi:predicted dehydrogenase